MWERTLQDLIRGLRANKQDEARFIAQALDEIRQEIRSKDMELKAGAVLKLTYLDMLGYDMAWASFHIVEVMSSSRIHLKSVGYLAAAQSFTQDTDVLMLTTNLLKKDFNSRPEDVAVSLNGYSSIVTPDLARDLSPDVIKMLTHSRAHIRKRAVIALYKSFMKYPEVLPHAMARLRERLDDPDAGVVAATVNVLCEFGRHNAQEFLPLAPQLFHLLTTTSNNWVLIKIVKLFGYLTPHEPRLVRKLQPPITELISTTPAISLLYECVRTCIIGGMLQGSSGNSLARTCVSKLATFLQDEDQNLKYIALMAMVKIVPSHPHLVAEYQDMILSSVDDQDISIRMRALDLISAMASDRNLQPIVQQLLSHLVRTESSALPSATQSLTQNLSSDPIRVPTSPSQNPAYRLILSQRILTLGSQNTYENVVDFEWYLSVLVDLAYVAKVDIGAQIREQLVDITARVRAARRLAVSLMVKLLCDDAFLSNAGNPGSCSEVLWAAAFICGEYCGELAEPQKLLSFLLQPRVLTLNADIISVYLQSATKVFGVWAAELADRWDNDDLPKVKETVDTVLERLAEFASNPDIEVQERAANITQLFTFIRADLNAFRPVASTGYAYDDVAASSSFDGVSEPRFPKSLYLIRPLFNSYDLNPVAPNAQESVPVPEGLDLNTWIVPPRQEPSVLHDEDMLEDEPKTKKGKKGKRKEAGGGKLKAKKKRSGEGPLQPDVLEPSAAETEAERAERERLKAERLERLKDDPYYITDDRSSRTPKDPDVDSIPIVRLDDLPPLSQVNARVPSLKSASVQPSRQAFIIEKVGEMPEGAKVSAGVDRASPVPSIKNGAATTATPAPLHSFAPYEVEDEGTRTGTPPPIKVTRAKKKTKTSTSGKKKRAASGMETPSSQ
ncbi:Adaptor protein complex AP-3 delta subunit [Panus rudis PR-1116 ss-1]|nr:Adaptor protein complex AP-3 delta subunit [Panus rudis PR-1116 ss-1]